MRDNIVVINNNNSVNTGGNGYGDGGFVAFIVALVVVLAIVEAWQAWVLFVALWIATFAILKYRQNHRRVKQPARPAKIPSCDQRLLSTGDMRWLDRNGYREPATVRFADDDNFDDSVVDSGYVDFDDGLDKWH